MDTLFARAYLGHQVLFRPRDKDSAVNCFVLNCIELSVALSNSSADAEL